MELFSFDDLPVEIKHALEHHIMHSEQNAHEVQEFFSSLDEQQLKNLRGLIKVIEMNESAGGYYAGIIGGELLHRFGVCMACGKKHDEELKRMAGEGPSEKRDEATLRDEYRVILTGVGEQVQCTDCGLIYSSLEDRMLRKPDECSGCEQKAKWG